MRASVSIHQSDGREACCALRNPAVSAPLFMISYSKPRSTRLCIATIRCPCGGSGSLGDRLAGTASQRHDHRRYDRTREPAVGNQQPAGRGAAIFAQSTGHLPGLSGRLNPIPGTSDRTYLYADNIAIKEGLQQPVPFRLGKALRLTDAYGAELAVTIVDIVGSSALLEYRPWKG